MQYQTQCALQVKGSRVERGAVIELTEDEAKRFDPADIVAVDGNEVEEEVAEPEKAVEDMQLDELKAKAEELGLSKSGSKADLVERINLHLEGGGEEELEVNDEQ